MPTITQPGTENKQKKAGKSQKMSAASQAVLQPSQVKNFCKTPLSYFLRLLKFLNYTELKVFCGVLVHTVGKFHPETFSEISDAQFEEATGVSSEYWREVLENLCSPSKWTGALVRRRKNDRGRYEYALSEKIEVELKALKVRGRCESCREFGEFETEFVPVPHVTFRKLGGCLNHSAFVCLMGIMRYSMKYTREQGICTQAVEIQVSEFCELTGLEARMVTDALARLSDPDGLALIERTERKGKPALYRVIPENFAKVERRDARVIVMPSNREKKANTTPTCKEENPNKNEKTHAIESADRYFGFCRSCGHFGAVEEVPDSEWPAEAPPAANSTPRHGPGRETKRKKPSVDEFWDDVKQKVR